MTDDQPPIPMVPLDTVRQIARDVAMVASLALEQSDGDAANAIARLEVLRGTRIVQENTTGFEADVVQLAQEAINAAAEVIQSGGAQ